VTAAEGATSRGAVRSFGWIAPLCLISALLTFAGLQTAARLYAGVFEYPLDDVYIHLAMAEEIARGHYGVNPGEAVGASSSVIYPLLLMPFPGTDLQWALPFLWNLAALSLAAWLFGLAIAEAAASGGLSAPVAGLIAVAAPFGLNMHGVAFTGMENMLHGAAALAVLLGLWRFLSDGRLREWFLAAVILSPLLRYEGLALSLAAVALIALAGRWRTALGVTLAVLVPLGLFSAFLVHLGLDALPGSVISKLTLGDPNLTGLARIAKNLSLNLAKPQGLYLVALVVLTLVLAVAHRGAARRLLAAVGLAGAAHLIVAQLGWMHRYEHYIVFTLVAALLLTMRRGAAGRVALGGVAFAVIGGVPAYQVDFYREYAWNPAAIHLQHAQMARFVHDELKAPVAVNDLGWVAWRNDNFVYDLWGLGSREALIARAGGTAPDGWAGPLLARRGIHVAMVYEKHFGKALGPGWAKVADLVMDPPVGRLGDWRVTFYADSPAEGAALHEMLTRFAPTLPAGAGMTFGGDGEDDGAG
jgi:hypothetical protein